MTTLGRNVNSRHSATELAVGWDLFRSLRNRHQGVAFLVGTCDPAGVRQALRGLPEAAVIEIGCGNGWILEQLEAEMGPSVRLFGVEPSDVGVGCLDKRCRGLPS